MRLALNVCNLHTMDKEYVMDRHRDVIKKLKFITLIEPGERINVSTISAVQESWFATIYRTIFKESRTKTLQFLSEVIDRSFELIFLYKDSKKLSDQISCYQILDDIIQSINGIKNIQVTYNSDRNFYCEMETLLSSIHARLAEIYQNEPLLLPQTTKEKLSKLFFTNEIIESDSLKLSAEPSSSVTNTPVIAPIAKQLDGSLKSISL